MRTRSLAFLATDWNIDTTLFSYDSDGRIDLITRPNGVTSDYGHDPAGNRTSMTYAAGVETYTINLINQLTGVSYPDGTSNSGGLPN